MKDETRTVYTWSIRWRVEAGGQDNYSDGGPYRERRNAEAIRDKARNSLIADCRHIIETDVMPHKRTSVAQMVIEETIGMNQAHREG